MADILLQWLDKPGSLTALMLVLVFSFIFTVFIHAQIKGQLSWLDLVCRSNTNIVSLSKVLQLVGGIVATWVVIKSTLLSNGAISWEIFTAYLAYVGSVEAYGKYVTLKRSENTQSQTFIPGNGGNIAQSAGGLKPRVHATTPIIESSSSIVDDGENDIGRVGGAKTIE